MSDELVNWLKAQLDEDQRLAIEASGHEWRWVDPGGRWKQALVADGYVPGSGWAIVVPSAAGDIYPSKADADFIAEHGPSRMIREAEAKRKILELHSGSGYLATIGSTTAPRVCARCSRAALFYKEDILFPCPTLRLLAFPYSKRTGYREEWRP